MPRVVGQTRLAHIEPKVRPATVSGGELRVERAQALPVHAVRSRSVKVNTIALRVAATARLAGRQVDAVDLGQVGAVGPDGGEAERADLWQGDWSWRGRQLAAEYISASHTCTKSCGGGGSHTSMSGTARQAEGSHAA